MPNAHKLHRVFVVDDEPVIASTLATILCRGGFEVRSFTMPREALLATQSEKPDLLISDVSMPVLSGIELATQVQQVCPNCKVLLFSGSSDFHANSKKGGQRFEVLTKPMHPSELLRKISEFD